MFSNGLSDGVAAHLEVSPTSPPSLKLALSQFHSQLLLKLGCNLIAEIPGFKTHLPRIASENLWKDDDDVTGVQLNPSRSIPADKLVPVLHRPLLRVDGDPTYLEDRIFHSKVVLTYETWRP